MWDLSGALVIADLIMAALSLLIILIAAFLPTEPRRKLLRTLGRKWEI